MQFLNPIGVAFLATLPVILALYILRLKRRQVAVSTTLFWRQVLEDVEANTPFQRLRYSHLLVLQLLIATLLVLALMQPAVVYPSTSGLDTLVILDTSASMGAVEGGQSRLETARQQIKRLIQDKGNRDRIALITAGQSGQVLAGLTPDKAALLAAVDRAALEPGGGALGRSGDLALQVIAEARERDRDGRTGVLPDLLGDGPSAQVVIFTDDPGGFGQAPESPQPIRWAVQPLGFADTTNAAILAASFTDPDPAKGTMALFLTTAWNGREPVEATLRVRHAGDLLDRRSLTLQPGREESHLFDGVPLREGRYELELEAGALAGSREAVSDALATDNTAYLVYAGRPVFRMLVLSGNGVYGLMLRSLPEVQVFQRTLAGGIPAGNYDLILVDGDLPLNAPPGNYLVIRSNNHDLLPVQVTGEVERPVISDWRATDPLLRFVNPQTFRIPAMLEVEPKEWGRVVLGTNKGPAILYGEQGQQRVVYWAFDPFATDLPFKATFPILLSAQVEFFRNRQGDQTLASSDLMRFAAPAAQVQVIRPDGSRQMLSAQPGEELALAPDALGFWRLEAQTPQGTFSKDFGVNLYAPGESVLPSGELFAGETGLATFEQTRRGTHPQWRWIALGVLLFLLAEWWIYHQRIF